MRNIKILSCAILFLLNANMSFAAADESCKNKIYVDVNGMVCDFCARAIEKVFSKRPEASGVKVNLDEGTIIITMKNAKSISDSTLTQLITDSGYDVVKIKKGCDE